MVLLNRAQLSTKDVKDWSYNGPFTLWYIEKYMDTNGIAIILVEVIG